METYLLSLLAATLVACGPGVDLPLGGRDIAVGIVDCLEPQRGWIRAEVESFGWHVSEAGEVDVRCTDTGEVGGAGMYQLGASEVLVDPVKAPGEFSMRAVSGHELTHWLLDHGPHPAFATLHVCTWAINDPVPPGCFPGATSDNALMSPGGSRDWDGTTETFSFNSVREYRITPADKALIDAALRQ
jgi:hypothetical protein